jgi:hypothetical protein
MQDSIFNRLFLSNGLGDGFGNVLDVALLAGL